MFYESIDLFGWYLCHVRIQTSQIDIGFYHDYITVLGIAEPKTEMVGYHFYFPESV